MTKHLAGDTEPCGKKDIFTQLTNSSPALRMGIKFFYRAKEQQFYTCLVYIAFMTPWSIGLWLWKLWSHPTSLFPIKFAPLTSWFSIFIIHIMHLLLQWWAALCASGAFGTANFFWIMSDEWPLLVNICIPVLDWQELPSCWCFLG